MDDWWGRNSSLGKQRGVRSASEFVRSYWYFAIKEQYQVNEKLICKKFYWIRRKLPQVIEELDIFTRVNGVCKYQTKVKSLPTVIQVVERQSFQMTLFNTYFPFISSDNCSSSINVLLLRYLGLINKIKKIRFKYHQSKCQSLQGDHHSNLGPLKLKSLQFKRNHLHNTSATLKLKRKDIQNSQRQPSL